MRTTVDLRHVMYRSLKDFTIFQNVTEAKNGLYDPFILLGYFLLSFIYDCILPECGGMNASGYCSIFIAFKSIPNSSIRPRRTVSFDGHGHSFNVCVVCFVGFPLDCLLFDDFSVLILLLCVLTVCLLLKRSACQIKSCTVRARMFIALIYRKRMEQTEYLIRMV